MISYSVIHFQSHQRRQYEGIKYNGKNIKYWEITFIKSIKFINVQLHSTLIKIIILLKTPNYTYIKLYWTHMLFLGSIIEEYKKLLTYHQFVALLSILQSILALSKILISILPYLIVKHRQYEGFKYND